MSLDMLQIKNLYTSITKSQMIIEMNFVIIAENIILQHDMKNTLEQDKQLYNIPVQSATIEVRVYDLPPHMSNNLITAHVSAYGKALSVWNDV